MSRKDDLEESIRESYGLVREYEQIRQTASDPKEKKRAQLGGAEQWALIKGYLDDYLRLCNRLQVEPAADVVEVAAILDHPLSFAAPRAVVDEVQGQSKPNPSALVSQNNVYALLVGIAAYRSVRSLSKTVTDVRDLYDVLLQNGYPACNVALLCDSEATKAAISDKLEWLARRAETGDTVVIFFSGHGAQYVGGFWPGEYLCPAEAALDRVKETLIAADEFSAALKSIRAGRLVVFLDACHAGGIGETKDPSTQVKAGLSDDAYGLLSQGQGRIVIASCRPDEVSYELSGMRNSLFTHYLLEGLRGSAAGPDGAVWMTNLFGYVYQQVSQHNLQHPFLKSASEDFILARASLSGQASGSVS